MHDIRFFQYKTKILFWVVTNSIYKISTYVEKHKMTNYIAEWNIFDSMIYKAENIVTKITSGIKDSKDELPDAEEMITAATAQLQQENNELKEIRMPGKLIKHGENYACPDCGREITKPYIIQQEIRFCAGCVKRIVLPYQSPYTTLKQDHNLVNDSNYINHT